MAYLDRIFIYPIKSLDGIAVNRAIVLESGALKGDREFAIIDTQGNYVNGKRNAKVHQIRSQFDLEERIVSLQIEGTEQTESFHLEGDRPLLEAWLSAYLGFPVTLGQNTEVGFPDDRDSPGPTVISTATLENITTWFSGVKFEDAQLRFRTNLEIGDVAAFWEDCLYGEADRVVPFQIGEVLMHGVNPCQRCIVPTRNAITGEQDATFQKTFVARRREMLPEWAERSRFNHFYKLAVNTRIPASQAKKVLNSGDLVKR
ncbi:MOSC N-terminal beta barrel domain-containing protein [Kovacikia minuta CCNUW1]|uniref:MOSC domain-containing protein n=1 Tax=Kovacikia minuta TaxID=2931930 RepID=UPI001CCC9158|nr:MOSC N-terminal beta barrel domain-containing protein [Kovacikia minuta]UBF24376.1 MOSC N-terminal beta barrel domain-containing protein [Kovacikia minuta CCNUW1]